MNGKVTACLAVICALQLLAIQANPVYDGELSQAERENLEALMDRANRRYLSRLVGGNYIKRGNAELVNGLLGMRYGDLMRAEIIKETTCSLQENVQFKLRDLSGGNYLKRASNRSITFYFTERRKNSALLINCSADKHFTQTNYYKMANNPPVLIYITPIYPRLTILPKMAKVYATVNMLSYDTKSAVRLRARCVCQSTGPVGNLTTT